MTIPSIKAEYYITYGIFYLLGILTFIPNYFVITANRYWMYKFRFNAPPPPGEGPGPGPPKERNFLQANFPSSYYISWQLSFIMFVILTAAYSKRLPPPDKRISASLLCTFAFYLINMIFCNLSTDMYLMVFFFMVMAMACFLGVCGAVILVSLFEMVRKFPTEYYNAILTGQCLCGAISSITQILTISATIHPVYGGLIFFGVGTLLVVITIAVYWYSKKNSQYFIYNVGNDNLPAEVTFDHRNFLPRMCHEMNAASKTTKMYVSSLILTAGGTAIVYPGFMALVVAQHSSGRISEGNIWSELYFNPVITFLLSSLCDLCGRILAARIQKPKCQIFILFVSIARLIFVPLMIFCNAQPRFKLPVIFYDIPYCLFTVVFSFSNGYIINLCVILVSIGARTEEEKNTVTIIAVISAVISAATTSFLSLLLIHLI